MKHFSSLIPKPIYCAGLFLCILLAGCGKEYSTEVGSRSVTGTWEFSEGGAHFQGAIDSAYIIRNTSINEMHLEGFHYQTSERFHLIIYADTFVPGTYKASQARAAMDYGNPPVFTYSAGQTVGEFTIRIISMNETILTGSFSGQAAKHDTATADITNGNFRVALPEKPNIPAAEGVLGNDAGNCLPIFVNGTYQQGAAMNSGNTVEVQVSVNQPGTYTIATDPVNGISFSGSGVFTARGTQTVTLTASGTPAFSGEQVFTARFGNSSCAFSISFATPAAPVHDHFPLSAGSFWKYENDAMYYVATEEIVQAENESFHMIRQFEEPTLVAPHSDFSRLVRKDAGNYYNLVDYAAYLGSAGPVLVETIILKDNMPPGTSWKGPTVKSETESYHLQYTITAKEATVAIGAYNLPDVIKLKKELFKSDEPTGISEERWYSFNVGLVYVKDAHGNEKRIEDYNVML